MRYSLKKDRLKFLSGVIFLIALILFAKLYLVQIAHGENYRNRADRQYLKPNTDVFDRGSIAFTTKDGDHIDAATLKTGYTLALNPRQITEPADTYNNISFVLPLEEEEFFQKATKDDPYEELAKRIPKGQADKIDELNLKGVSLYKERWRFYPGKTLGAHVLGFMSYKGDEIRGQYGLERHYNDVLSKTEENLYANFFVEIFSGLGNTLNGKDRSGSLVTTIEPTVQTFVERELEETESKWNARKVGAIVMDPSTGEIISMALNPTFDLNTFNETNDISIFNNDLVESVYEMGSIIKPLTIAIGLDTGKISPSTTYEDKGQMTLNGRTFFNHDKKVRGVVDMQEVINQSLNTGVAFVVGRVGNDTFSEYMKKLLGEKTGIDLPNESGPLVDNLDSPRDIEHATASFGQGIALTPIGTIRALAALGNGGLLINPHLVKEVKYDVGFNKKINQNDPERIFSEETSEEISRMLVNAVDEALLDGAAALPNHTVAAKTGTAQIADSASGGYYDDRTLHSFFGYFPAYDPEFIVLLYQTEPTGAEYSSQTLSEPFFNIAEFLINYYEIPPDR